MPETLLTAIELLWLSGELTDEETEHKGMKSLPQGHTTQEQGKYQAGPVGTQRMAWSTEWSI